MVAIRIKIRHPFAYHLAGSLVLIDAQRVPISIMITGNNIDGILLDIKFSMQVSNAHVLMGGPGVSLSQGTPTLVVFFCVSQDWLSAHGSHFRA